MFSLDVKDSRWDERIARARQLAQENPPAADLLEFYAALAGYQQALLERCGGDTEALDHEWVIGALSDFVSWLPGVAPTRVREAAHALRDLTAAEWRERLDEYKSRGSDAADRFGETTVFVLEAILQPLAERLASSHRGSVRLQADEPSPAEAGHYVPGPSGGAVCPACGGSPGVGVLREEGHGARRALVCGLCLTEWDYLRLVCAWCGEHRFESLPVFTAEQFPHVRIEACDTCRTYLKTIDLTKDGRAVPVVDDIASISLDLWARDRGYTRLRASLVRT
jgi:FdhE protein